MDQLALTDVAFGMCVALVCASLALAGLFIRPFFVIARQFGRCNITEDTVGDWFSASTFLKAVGCSGSAIIAAIACVGMPSILNRAHLWLALGVLVTVTIKLASYYLGVAVWYYGVKSKPSGAFKWAWAAFLLTVTALFTPVGYMIRTEIADIKAPVVTAAEFSHPM